LLLRIAFAAKAGSAAKDGTGAHSPFTAALLRYLAIPGLDLRFVFGRVRDDVLRATDNQQEPFLYGSLGGETVSIVAPVADPNRFERASDEIAWDLVKDSRDAELLRRFVEQFPRSSLRANAEQRIAALVSNQRKIEQQEMGRSLQRELKRVGCFEGAIDGELDDGTRTALRNFSKYSAVKLPDEVLLPQAIYAVRSFDKRVCPDVRRFDGVWTAKVICEAQGDVQGFSYEFMGRVTDRVLKGERGVEGQPGWNTFDGTFELDGSIEITWKGLTAPNPKSTLNHTRPGVPFTTRAYGKFEGSRGSVIRVEGRTCRMDFSKLDETRPTPNPTRAPSGAKKCFSFQGREFCE
jgi:hypothetical protein